MAIPYGHQSLDESDIEAVVNALRSEWLTTGPRVASFEQAIAGIAGVGGAAAVSSGTAALHCAYAALGVAPGDEVITTPLTFVATAATAVREGARIVFADVQDDTGNLNPVAVAAAVGPRTKIVAGVDYAGHPIDADELLALAHGAGAFLLEDAAHSIASTYKGRPVGTLADATTFSFFPTKNLTSGEGGAVVAPDPALVERARRFGRHGSTRDPNELRDRDQGGWYYEVRQLSLNYRLPDVLCALGESQILRIAEFKTKRDAVFERYAEGLAGIDGLRLPTKRPYVDPIWHLYPVRVPADRRRSVFDFMQEQGIQVQVNYIPVYWHPAFQDLGYRRGMCPIAEQFYREEISLPMYADLTPGDQDRVIESLREALK